MALREIFLEKNYLKGHILPMSRSTYCICLSTWGNFSFHVATQAMLEFWLKRWQKAETMALEWNWLGRWYLIMSPRYWSKRIKSLLMTIPGIWQLRFGSRYDLMLHHQCASQGLRALRLACDFHLLTHKFSRYWGASAAIFFYNSGKHSARSSNW